MNDINLALIGIGFLLVIVLAMLFTIATLLEQIRDEIARQTKALEDREDGDWWKN